MHRSKHKLSHYRLMSGHMGYLLPCGVVEVLPGDTFDHSTSALLRVSPMAAPVMHSCVVRVHHFFVPNRIVWDDWENFITGGPDGMDASVPPTITVAADPTTQPLLDYLGIPPVTGVAVSALPVRAYNMVFNEFYRDQDLVTARAEGDVSLARIAWEKDYLTSARPWAQKGPDVVLPIGTRAPIYGIGKVTGTFDDFGVGSVRETGGTAPVAYTGGSLIDPATGPDRSFAISEDPGNPGFPGIYADLANATSTPILDVRRAFALQRYEEARARYGSRYTEYLRYLGVRSSDARLQRPEYLGGGKQTIAFSEVLQTGEGSDVENVVGSMRGHGISSQRSRRYRRFFEEHGFVISLISIRPKAMYMQAIHKQWLRTTKEDYFQKELEHLGQQEVMLNEVYASAADGTDVFGYADRYRDYREHPSIVTGEFRDSTLDFWHMAREFGAAPTLNSSFVQCDPTNRIFADQTGTDTLWMMIYHKLIARRLVSRNADGKIL